MNTTSEYVVIGATVVALVSLCAIVNYAVSIMKGIQQMKHAANPPRNPPLPEIVARDYATKRELSIEINELKQEIKEERGRVDAILKQQYDLIRNLTAETNKRYVSLEASIKEWQLGIERLIGKIEGKVESK